MGIGLTRPVSPGRTARFIADAPGRRSGEMPPIAGDLHRFGHLHHIIVVLVHIAVLDIEIGDMVLAAEQQVEHVLAARGDDRRFGDDADRQTVHVAAEGQQHRDAAHTVAIFLDHPALFAQDGEIRQQFGDPNVARQIGFLGIEAMDRRADAVIMIARQQQAPLRAVGGLQQCRAAAVGPGPRAPDAAVPAAGAAPDVPAALPPPPAGHAAGDRGLAATPRRRPSNPSL